MADISFTPATPTNGVTRCTNLRTSLSSSSLIQASQATHHIDGGWTPLLTLDSDGDKILLARDRQIGVLSGSTVTLVGTASSPVTCALSDSSTLITVMTKGGPEYLALTSGSNDNADGYTWLGSKPDFPEVRFSAEMRGTLSVPVPAHTFTSIDLSGEVPAIGHDEVEAYSSRLTDTYSELSAMATAGGVWVQPVMVRAFYIDSAGKVIHACAPVIVGPTRGWQGVGVTTVGLTRHSDTSATVNAWKMELQSYVINMQTRLNALPSPWQQMIARIVVCVSPQLHPFSCSASSLMAWRINNPRGANPTIAIAMPEATSNFASLDRWRLSEVAAMTARMLLSRPEEMYSEDYYSTFQTGEHILTPLRRVTPREERTRLESFLKKSRAAVDMRMAELSYPHRFSASCGQQAGVWQMWGNLTPRLYSGLRPCDFGVSDDDVADRGFSVVCVSDTDGKRHILSASSSMPRLISPMLLYPHTGAMTLILSMTNAAGAILSREFELCPVPGTSWSVALNANLAAINPDTFPTTSSSSTTLFPVAGSGAMAPREDAVTVTARRSWTAPLSNTTCSHGSVTTFTPGSRTGTIPDSSKTRTYIFATSGIYTASITSRGIIDSPHRIDIRPILSPSHVAYTPDGVYAAGASELVRVHGNRSVTVLRDFHPGAIAWHPTFNELWHTDRLGNMRFLSLPSMCDSTLSMPYQPIRLTTLGSKLWITGNDTMTQAPDRENPVPDDLPIEWEGHHYYTQSTLPTRLTIEMSADNFTGDIELSIDWGGTVFPIMTLTVDGPVDSPISQPLFLPSDPWNRLMTRPYFILRIHGSATALRLRSFHLE